MRPYHLEKWYFDALIAPGPEARGGGPDRPTSDGTYLFCYLARIRFVGWRQVRFSLSIAKPSGESCAISIPLTARHEPEGIALRRIVTDQGDIDAGPERCRVHLKSRDVEVGLDYRGDRLGECERGSLVISTDGQHEIRWFPIALRAPVEGTVRLGGQELVVAGADGYVDYMSADILPPCVPVTVLHWGRVHSVSCDLTYAHVEWRQRTWARVFARVDDRSLQLDDVQINDSAFRHSRALNLDYPTESRLVARSGEGLAPGNQELAVQVSLRHVRNAVESRFLERQSAGAVLSSGLVRLLARDPKGIKFWSRADLSVRLGETTVEVADAPSISEYVRFRGG